MSGVDASSATPGSGTSAGSGTSDVSFGDWLVALRSGDYEQTLGRLRAGDGFCCIGVAADLVDPDGWLGPGVSWLSGSSWRGKSTLGVTTYIPWMTWEVTWLGMDLNDNQRLSFPEIANRMEAEFPELLNGHVGDYAGGDDA